MSLTKGQALVLEYVTDEPQTAAQIARQAGLIRKSVQSHLLYLNGKGKVRRVLNPTRWVRA